MRSPKDIAAAIRQKQAPAEPTEAELDAMFLEEDDLFSEEEPVEAPSEPTDYKKRIGSILRSTRAVKRSGGDE